MHGEGAAVDQKNDEDSRQDTPRNQQTKQFPDGYISWQRNLVVFAGLRVRAPTTG
jgi:hypothetical protein